MAGDGPHKPRGDERRDVEAAEQERRRLERERAGEAGERDTDELDQVRETLRNHDERLREPDGEG